tara:strand:+ start:32555 stop:33283 length:729 start_codon:yes stop_codon:yes gene_type:complete
MVRTVHRMLRAIVVLTLIAAMGLMVFALTRSRPQDLPWTALDLAHPVGLFTGRKLAGLTEDGARCKALLDKAGVDYVALPPLEGPRCGYDDAVRLQPADDQLAYRPADVAPSCPVAAALKLWEWNVLQPAAHEIFGKPVKEVTHFGSYSCRRLYGREEGDYSEHATADAIDISGFVLTDGTRITIMNDWNEETGKTRFLHRIRDEACSLFSTVLSPDYNAAHADHLHLDQAERGALGWRACR